MQVNAISTKTRVIGGALAPNHNESIAVKSRVSGGSLGGNHNESITVNKTTESVAIRTRLTAGHKPY